MEQRGSLRRSLGLLLRSAAAFDRSQSDPIIAGRNAVGLLLALAIPAAFGSGASGAQSGVGALQTALADRPGPYRLRLVRMLLCAVLAATTAGLAAAFGANALASAALLFICSVGAGMALLFGPSATQVGLAATITALVVGHIAQSPEQALRTGLLVVGGGALQVVLAIGAWPLGRHRPERLALAHFYRDLARLAADPVPQTVGPPTSASIDLAKSVLTGLGHDHGPSVEAYRVLLDQGMSARRTILVLASYADRASHEGQPEVSATIRDALQTSAGVITELAQALEEGGDTKESDRARRRAAIAAVRDARGGLGDGRTEQAAASLLAGLASALAAMARTVRTGASEGRVGEEVDSVAGSVAIRSPWPVLRANLDRRSPALRHALRLGVLVPSIDLISRALQWERGYWVSLTVLVVLRPDFGATFQRVLLRVVGTLTGLVLASLIVRVIPAGTLVPTIIVIALLFFGMRLAGPNNPGLSSVFLSALIVLLLSLAAASPSATEINRGVATMVGGVIAVAASLVLPTWERARLPDNLRVLITAYRDYLRVLCGQEITSGGRSGVRARARLARSNAQASLDRVRSEPVQASNLLQVGSSVLSNTHRLVHALTALDSSRQAATLCQNSPTFSRLMDAVEAQLNALVQALADGGAVGEGSLRREQVALEEAAPVEFSAAGLDESQGAVVLEACDRIVVTLESLTASVSEIALVRR